MEQGWGSELGFPGLIIDGHGADVPGLVFSSKELAGMWQVLDEFEGDDYQRVTTQASFSSGDVIDVKVYVIKVD